MLLKYYLVGADVVGAGWYEDDVTIEGAFTEDAVAVLAVQVKGVTVLQPRIDHRAEVRVGQAYLYFLKKFCELQNFGKII